MTKNNFPPIVEQLIIENKTTKSTQTQLQASDILKTKQLIPHNFIQLETKGKNYMCSTEGWKEPICERYGFTYEGKWIQLDISHEVMKQLELSKGENISYPVYVSSELLNKEPEFGGITLEKKDEVFLLKPLTKDEGTQTEMSGERIEELERKVEEQARRIRELEIGNSNKDNVIKGLRQQLNTFLKVEEKKNWKSFLIWIENDLLDKTKPKISIGSHGKCYPFKENRTQPQTNIYRVKHMIDCLYSYVNKIDTNEDGIKTLHLPLSEYEENKTFWQLFKNDGKGGVFLGNYSSVIPDSDSQYVNLFEEWKKSIK